MYKILNKTYSKLPIEQVEQQELILWLKKNKYFFFSANNENSHSFSNRQAAIKIEQKAKSMGKLKGVSDLCIFTNEVILFIELKRQKPILKNGNLGKSTNDASKEQLDFIEKVSNYSYAKGYVAYGCDEAIKIISNYK